MKRPIVLLTLIALTIAACGGDSGATTTGADGATTTAAGGTDFVPRVEIPQTDDMMDTTEYATDTPWTIGYSDASSVELGPGVHLAVRAMGPVGISADR